MILAAQLESSRPKKVLYCLSKNAEAVSLTSSNRKEGLRTEDVKSDALPGYTATTRRTFKLRLHRIALSLPKS